MNKEIDGILHYFAISNHTTREQTRVIEPVQIKVIQSHILDVKSKLLNNLLSKRVIEIVLLRCSEFLSHLQLFLLRFYRVGCHISVMEISNLLKNSLLEDGKRITSISCSSFTPLAWCSSNQRRM
jgi:hypothetical protein